MIRFIRVSLLLAVCVALSSGAKAVVFGEDARLTADQYAQKHHLDAGDVKRRHAASGVIHCGNARGAGQLTLSNSVITTAAHVLFNERGEPRGDSEHCLFTATINGEDVTSAIDTASVITGATSPYAGPAVHDWAVARLMRPMIGATPYRLGVSAQSGQDIRFVARGHQDWGAGKVMSMEKCALRNGLASGAEGTREFAFDCDAGDGASGGAVLNDSSGSLMAVFVGYRSTAPQAAQPFSMQHYNFAVSVDGAFRRAVQTAASQASDLSAAR